MKKVVGIITLLVVVSFAVPSILLFFSVSLPFGILECVLTLFTSLSALVTISYLCFNVCKTNTPEPLIRESSSEQSDNESTSLLNNDTPQETELSIISPTSYAGTLPKLDHQPPPTTEPEEEKMKGPSTRERIDALQTRVAHVMARAPAEQEGIPGKLLHPEARSDLKQLKDDITNLMKELEDRAKDVKYNRGTLSLLREVGTLGGTLNNHINDEIVALGWEMKKYKDIINRCVVKHFKKTALIGHWSKYFVQDKNQLETFMAAHVDKEKETEQSLSSNQQITAEREDIYRQLLNAIQDHNNHINSRLHPENSFLINEKTNQNIAQESVREREERDQQAKIEEQRNKRYREVFGLPADVVEDLTPHLHNHGNFFS